MSVTISLQKFMSMHILFSYPVYIVEIHPIYMPTGIVLSKTDISLNKGKPTLNLNKQCFEIFHESK